MCAELLAEESGASPLTPPAWAEGGGEGGAEGGGEALAPLVRE